jgi:glycosyltransferase involved in cell wall biosynthesis
MKVNRRPLKSRKILHLTQLFGMGGLERVILSLTCEFGKRGEPSEVFVYDDTWEAATLAKRAVEQGITVHLEKKEKGFSFKLVFRILAYCRKRGVGVIHTHDLNALIYGVFAKLLSFGRLKVVHTQHSFVHLDRPRQRLFEQIFPRFADSLVCPSESNRDQYLKLRYPMTKLQVIANGVELGAIPTSATHDRLPESLKHLVSPHLQRLRVLYLGRLHPGKGQDQWIELWRRLKPELRSHLFTFFVGPETDPKFTAELKRKASEAPDAGQLCFVGETSQPLDYLAVSDVLISFSAFEGMPLVPVEASGMGLTLILSDISGHRTLGLSPRQCTLIEYPPSSSAALYELEQKLEEALKLRKSGVFDTFSAEAKEVRQRFSIERMADEYRTIYMRVQGLS